jgi:DNA-binding transcriptional ArsR family regulator
LARCAGRETDRLGELGGEVIAHRLRTLGHPTRLRLLRALDGRDASVEQLAGELGVSVSAARAHLRVLCRAGVTCRIDHGGPELYRLVDWPSLWLVDQLARRLATQAHNSYPTDDSAEASWR